MHDLIKKGLALGVGLAAYSKDQIEKVVDELVKRGEVPLEESKQLIKDLIDRGEKEKTELKDIIAQQVSKALEEVNMATKASVEELEERIKILELKVSSLEAQQNHEESNKV